MTKNLRSALRHAVLVAGFLLAALPAQAQRFGAESFTLANGMQGVVIPSHRVPAVTHMVWYKVGAADEPLGKSGIAHFLEHLMFKGTKQTPPGMFSRIVAQNGGRDNAFTTQDYTGYHQTVAADRLELVMKLEADRMNGLILSDAVVKPELLVVLEERRARIDNEPSALLNEQLRTGIFLHHPYRIPTIGWEQEIRGLTTADAIAFYNQWYAPNNAILVVSGDVTTAQVKALAEKYYGPLPRKELPTRTRVQEPKRVAATRMELKSPRVTEATWSRSYLAPSFSGGETKHAYPLQVLAEILSNGATSRLYRILVLEKQVALRAGAFYAPGSLDLTTFGFYANPRPGVTVETVENAVAEEIRNLLESGVTPEEAERAKTRMQAEQAYARDSLSGPANLFGAALAVGRTVEDVESWPDRIAAVTVDQINQAAKFVIDDRTAVTGLLLPEPSS
jgi:zinc protease